MKKLIALLLALVMVFALGACAKDNPAAAPDDGAPETEVPETETPETETPETETPDDGGDAEPTDEPLPGGGSNIIYVITPSHSNPFFKTEADTATAKAQELGYEVKSVSHDDDPTKQCDQFFHCVSS